MASRRVAPMLSTASDDGPQTFKERAWELVDDPSSSAWARAVSTIIMLLIGISCATFCIETLPVFHRKNAIVWETIEAVCIVFFTLEYVVRLLSCPNKCKFLKGILNTIDLIAIVPFYLELLLGSGDSSSSSSAVFRVVRLVRVFRVFKISRYVTWIKLFGTAMVNSSQPLGMLLFVMTIGIVVFSSAMYFVERGTWDEANAVYIDETGAVSPFQSIPDTFWWCVITMTTVGYGDHSPITVGGRIIAAATSICGVLVIAIPITVISANFNQEFVRMQKKREALRVKMLLFKHHFENKGAGLGLIKHEIDTLVQRNAEELSEELHRLTRNSRDELASELYQLVKLAHRKRVQQARERLSELNGTGRLGVAQTATSAPISGAASKYSSASANAAADGTDGPPSNPLLTPTVSDTPPVAANMLGVPTQRPRRMPLSPVS